jgi:hypothetical protein
MSEFDTIREALSKTRGETTQEARALALDRQRLRNIEQDLARLERARRDSGGHEERISQLQQEAARLRPRIKAARATLSDLAARSAGLLGDLTALADPREQIAQLEDAFPFLLFPLRLETRFKSTVPPGAAAPVPELWVRAYPDDCQVDAFEELLSDTDVKGGRAFWVETWKAGGFEDQKRGAWRTLVGSVGSGRAGWIIEQIKPAAGTVEPVKVNTDDIILVIVPGLVLTGPETTQALAFWVAMWKADGDVALEQAAFSQLKGAVGAARAAEIVEKFRPENLDQDPVAPGTRATVTPSTAILPLEQAQPVTKTTSWTAAPRARAMPDRIVVLCYNGTTEAKRAVGKPIPDGLATGPDPSLPDAEQIQLVDGDLVVNDDVRWMVDFERAVEVGMGVKIPLTQDEARAGFSRLLVLGLRLSADHTEGQTLVESLIRNHHRSRHGFGLVPQGSPTNNTEGEGAAFSWTDDADSSYDVVFKGKDSFAPGTDVLRRRDGERLARSLGIDPSILQRVPHSGGTDGGEARAMNTALWPATLGYFMDDMMGPLFTDEDKGATRRFFTTYVSGRGPVPAVRVARQPYGILPVMPFARYKPTPRSRDDAGPAGPSTTWLARLHGILVKMDTEWSRLSSSVASVGSEGDGHQVLLDVLGLHSGSVEFHQRYAQSLQALYNRLVYQYGSLIGSLLASWLGQRGQTILQQLGIAVPDGTVPILEKFFYGSSPLLTGPVVDDVPLSETVPIRDYSTDNKNYLEWLRTSSLDTIRLQDFGGNPAPTALLYLMLRHSLMLCNWDAVIRILGNRNLVDVAAVRREPSFLHVQAQAPGVSRFEHLYRTEPLVTGDSTTTLAEHVLKPEVLTTAPETQDLGGIMRALEFLENVPTARLERVFSEHVDCCSYRLDAWKTGLAATRLEELRDRRPDAAGTRFDRGLYIGAYGWLEDVKPEPRSLRPAEVPEDLKEVFERAGEAPLVTDATNGGYIHAPSLDQAAAAAVLKNAYGVNASSANRDVLAVNLSSERVRRALDLLEGIRNGQSLGELLGYRFERGLHDRHGLAEVDKFIYPLRQLFPLVANRLKDTLPDDPTDIKLMEARNVLDGIRLIEHLRAQNTTSYPFGVPLGSGPGQLRPATDDERRALDAEIQALLDLHDSVSDVVLSENVYQVVRGNFERAAANSTAFSKGSHPPDVEVVRTPRSGRSLTHRVALQLDTATSPVVSPSAVPMTPRATAEAALNKWLADRLPTPDHVVCSVRFTTPAAAAPPPVVVSQQDLGLQPIDLLHHANLELEQAKAELDDRILQFVRYSAGPSAHAAIGLDIRYADPVSGELTFFEIAPLVRSLRKLLLGSRHLMPTDVALPLEAESIPYTYDFTDLDSRVGAAITALSAHVATLAALEADTSDADLFARKVSDEMLALARFGIPQTGTGDIHERIRALYAGLISKVRELTTRWAQKRLDFTAALATFPSLTTDEERFALLLQAEGLIKSTTTTALPANPNIFKASVEADALVFDGRRAAFTALLTPNTEKLVDYIAAVDAQAAFAPEHDAIPFAIDSEKAALAALVADLHARVTAVKADVIDRLAKAQQAQTEAAVLHDPEPRVRRSQQAAALVLGEEMKVLPRFTFSSPQGAELQNCVSDAASLLTYLETDRGRLFPLDDWMYGVARVREKMAHWENTVLLAECFQRTSPALTALQLPYRANDRWLGLEFPDTVALDTDKLLYTAHFAGGFTGAAAQCGLLLDEWTEVIPAKEEITGVSFHFDRPSCEPPQAMLLALPAVRTGRWQWKDLVDVLHETLDNARKRGVEPAHVDGSAYAQFLPATLMAVTLYQMTIATNLAVNNHIYAEIAKVDA